jgi:hypothetical protein
MPYRRPTFYVLLYGSKMTVNWRGSHVGRLGGCAWLTMAGLGYLFVTAALGVGIDASAVLVPLVVVPLVLGALVLVGGRWAVVLAISAAAGFGYAVLGVQNYIRAEAFERANPGATEISGGGMSITFVFIALAIGLWSAAAAALAWRQRRR